MISRKAILLAASAFTLSPAAFAQERDSTVQTTQTGAQAADSSSGLEDIVVTARKTEERLSDAPVAVSALSERRIAELGLNSIDDFAKQATGVSFSQAFGRASDRPVIRGQSNVLANVQFGVETGAAYFLDGIYYQGDIQGLDPESLARVEIIKGPQSALYGRNTYAGAINFITKDPTNEFSGSARATVAEHDEYQIGGSVSGPIVADKIGFRVGARYSTYGGEYTNQLTGKKVGDTETKSVYLTLVLKPTDDIKIRPRLSYQHDDDGPLAIFLQGAATNNCKPGFRSPNYRSRSAALPFIPNTLGTSSNTNQYYCGTIKPQPNNVRLNTDPVAVSISPFAGSPAVTGTYDGTAFDGVENKQILVSNIADWDIGGSGYVLSSLTGYRDLTNRFGTDSDHSESFFYFNLNPAFGPAAGGSTPNPAVTEPAFANTTRTDTWDISQEVRLASPTDQPIRFLVGAYYFKQKSDNVDLTFASPRQGVPFGSDQTSRNYIEDKAVFGLVGWNITDSLSITGEVRYAEEIKKQIARSGTVFNAGYGAGTLSQFGCAGASATCAVLPRAKFTGTDPRVTIDYKTPGGALFYGVYAQGRKPGGFNGTAGFTAAQQTGFQSFITYLPEKSKGFEVGTKFDALDNTLRMSFAGYTNKLTNVQLTTAIPNPNGTGAITSIVTNQGDARTSGFEVEAQVAPTEGLNMSLGVSYVDAHFTKGCDADLFILNSGGLRPNFDTRNPPAAAVPLCSIKNKKLPLGSPWIVNGSASYEKPIGTSDLKAWTNVNFSFEDKKYVQTDNLAAVGDTFLLNARIGVRNDRFSLAFFGRNLTDEDSVPLATRWFDYRYGAGTRGLTPPATGNPPVVPFNGGLAQVETGAPRAFFGTLRPGRTFGVEGTFKF